MVQQKVPSKILWSGLNYPTICKLLGYEPFKTYDGKLKIGKLFVEQGQWIQKLDNGNIEVCES